MMENIFTNKVALVTGGSFGIGQATAIAFAKQGAKVVVADSVEKCETHKIIQESGGDAIYIECDVSKTSDIKLLIEKIIEKYGRLDYAYNNNFGNEIPKTIKHGRQNDSNLERVWQCMKYQIPEILKNGKGAIVNSASIAGLVGFSGLPVYVASKHDVIGLTKSAALENVENGIRINAVCLRTMKTPMVNKMQNQNNPIEKTVVEGKPINSPGETEEVANAVLWLCSDEACYLTGHTMAVDGVWETH